MSKKISKEKAQTAVNSLEGSVNELLEEITVLLTAFYEGDPRRDMELIGDFITQKREEGEVNMNRTEALFDYLCSLTEQVARTQNTIADLSIRKRKRCFRRMKKSLKDFPD